MKKLELSPTDDNIIATLKENIFGRNTELGYFLELLNHFEDAYSIAIDGKWGSGKTFFVKQAKLALETCNVSISRECKIVCVNRYCMNLLYAPYWGKQR